MKATLAGKSKGRNDVQRNPTCAAGSTSITTQTCWCRWNEELKLSSGGQIRFHLSLLHRLSQQLTRSIEPPKNVGQGRKERRSFTLRQSKRDFGKEICQQTLSLTTSTVVWRNTCVKCVGRGDCRGTSDLLLRQDRQAVAARPAPLTPQAHHQMMGLPQAARRPAAQLLDA